MSSGVIVNQDDVARVRRLLHRDEAVVDGVMARGATGDDDGDFLQHVLVDVVPEAVNPAFEADDDDFADVGMTLEFLQRVEDDGPAMHHEELFRLRAGIHAAARAAREDEDFDHRCTSFIEKIRIRRGCRSSARARACLRPA